MNIQTTPLQTKSLRRAGDSTEYNVYQAALEWSLTEPIIIESRQDLRSEREWHDKVTPYHHQVTNLISFCRRVPVTLLADDVGLGKTISAGLILSELMVRNRISKILVICPKLLMPQWKEELKTKFGIESIEASGRVLIKAKIPENGGIVITTYHSARLHFDKIATAGYDMLILDEAHKLRNLYGTDKSPQVAQKIRKALADRNFKYVLMLTATPIQNRLWDIYSLIDLLTVAKGHENPFGSQAMFARNFIDDDRETARKLKPDMRDAFRSIIISHMSRVRRADANLYFPDRKVQLHKVQPTQGEKMLFDVVSNYIQKLNPLSQYGVLLDLTSSPEALISRLKHMAENETAPREFYEEAKAVVENNIGMTAKLRGLKSLIDELKKEKPIDWRMVVFTESRETQASIEAYLIEEKIPCGLINGDSAIRNQQAIKDFQTNPPKIHVIVSTRAGSEGVNLQVANVLVNYDLPWNPMIVEQRIGRVQRLASNHEYVCIFNMLLEGTFEEFVVGRLMEKLQLASHAIGDVEALLEAAGMDDDETDSFEEKVRNLVLSALAGKDTEKATQLAEKSIENARTVLSQEEQTINQMLGGHNGTIDLGPQVPKLPVSTKSMDAKKFALTALEKLGAEVIAKDSETYEVSLDGRRELICFDGSNESATHCRPGTPFFEKLANRLSASGLHSINDVDKEPTIISEKKVSDWLQTFDGSLISSRLMETLRCFEGTAVLRVRATVAHDSYERLVSTPCKSEGKQNLDRDPIQPMGRVLEDPAALRLPESILISNALEDDGISEFCRFYQERAVDEVRAAGSDERKIKKLQDDFTPRISCELVGLEGKVYRELKYRITYKIENANYESNLTIIPSQESINCPPIAVCDLTNLKAPEECFSECKISKKHVLKHLLVRSEVSNRMALPNYITTCSFSGKRILTDEIEKSSITGKDVASIYIKTSPISGKRAEPNYFKQCEFSNTEILDDELVVSRVSGKRFRIDESTTSVLSGKTGHRLEFIKCEESGQPLLSSESEQCAITGKRVIPSLLEECAISQKKVLPSELNVCAVSNKKAIKSFFTNCAVTRKNFLTLLAEKCEVTGSLVVPDILEKCEISNKMVIPTELQISEISGKKALKSLYLKSSVSDKPLLEIEAIRSKDGKLCRPDEARICNWSGQKLHPSDTKICELTNLEFAFERISNGRFEILSRVLNGEMNLKDTPELWADIESQIAQKIKVKNCKLDSSVLSPDFSNITVSAKIASWLGMKTEYAGCLFSIKNRSIIGNVVIGKRNERGSWISESEEQRLKEPKMCSYCKEKNNSLFKDCWKCKRPLN